MTGYKVIKRTRMCFERTDRAISIGRSPLCGGSLKICYMLFLTLMHPLEVITSLWYPSIIWGENYCIAMFPLFTKGGIWLHSHFSREKIYSIAIFSAYPGKGEIWLWGKRALWQRHVHVRYIFIGDSYLGIVANACLLDHWMRTGFLLTIRPLNRND
jgi:hypothetical protein